MSFPKPGDEVGERTVISVKRDMVIFGRVEKGIRNCGAWVTDFEEWFEYAAAIRALKDKS